MVEENNPIEPPIRIETPGIETLTHDQFLKVIEILRRETVPKADLTLIGQIFGASALEEYRSMQMHLASDSSPVRGAITRFYILWDGKKQGVYGFNGEEGRTRNNQLSRFIQRVRVDAADNSHGRLNERSLPELFALAFKDHSLTARNLSAVSRDRTASGNPYDFREALRAKWFDEVRYSSK